jgi:hypothetical protein
VTNIPSNWILLCDCMRRKKTIARFGGESQPICAGDTKARDAADHDVVLCSYYTIFLHAGRPENTADVESRNVSLSTRRMPATPHPATRRRTTF